jgi:hypothetical protein
MVAAIVEILMIEPPPLIAMRGAIAAVRKNGAFTLTSKVRSNAASVVWSVGPPGNTPALLTSTSTPLAACARRLTSAKLARSAAMNRALPPAAVTASTTSRPRTSSRPLMITSAPSLARRAATARPI